MIHQVPVLDSVMAGRDWRLDEYINPALFLLEGQLLTHPFNSLHTNFTYYQTKTNLFINHYFDHHV